MNIPYMSSLSCKRVYVVILITRAWLFNYSLLVVDFCLLIRLLNSILDVSKPQTRAYVFFHNWKSIRCIHKKICIVLRTLSQIQWCNFCIENLNLEFVFVIPIECYAQSLKKWCPFFFINTYYYYYYYY